MCNFLSKKCQNGYCIGSYTGNKAECICKPGWQGSNCDEPTLPKMFQQRSFVKYSLSQDLDAYQTEIQLRFRTRQPHGELIRLSSRDKRQYCILEIRDSKIRFRFNLNQMRSMAEKELALHYVYVSDGQWHDIHIKRFGSNAVLTLDGGGIKKINELIGHKDSNQLLNVDKSSIVVGGDVHYLGVGASVVGNDFADGMSHSYIQLFQ